MASLLKRSKYWDSFVPPPGFEGPRTAELKFLIFFATAGTTHWWHPTEVATRVGSGNRDVARFLCLKLAASGWVNLEVCHIAKREVTNCLYELEVYHASDTARDKSPLDFAMGFKASSTLLVEYGNGQLLGQFRIAKSDRRPLATRILEYMVEHPEPIGLRKLKNVIRATGHDHVFQRCIMALERQHRIRLAGPNRSSGMRETVQIIDSEWLKQETKRQRREERERVKKATALRKRRRTLKKKAKKRKRPRCMGALEL